MAWVVGWRSEEVACGGGARRGEGVAWGGVRGWPGVGDEG